MFVAAQTAGTFIPYHRYVIYNILEVNLLLVVSFVIFNFHVSIIRLPYIVNDAQKSHIHLIQQSAAIVKTLELPAF